MWWSWQILVLFLERWKMERERGENQLVFSDKAILWWAGSWLVPPVSHLPKLSCTRNGGEQWGWWGGKRNLSPTCGAVHLWFFFFPAKSPGSPPPPYHQMAGRNHCGAQQELLLQLHVTRMGQLLHWALPCHACSTCPRASTEKPILFYFFVFLVLCFCEVLSWLSLFYLFPVWSLFCSASHLQLPLLSSPQLCCLFLLSVPERRYS